MQNKLFKIIAKTLKGNKTIKYMVIVLVNDKVTPNVTISLKPEEKKLFEELQKKETRGPSDQFRHMMKSYVENKDKVK